ncbi:MAG: nitroreductase family protein [Chloroflexi bacterium]|nr:nitroreductase family protein [Chloroflexota bacterium]
MDTLEAIRKRRSIRRYTDDAIPKADLETIVDAGRLAATGNNRQPWDFVVVTDRTMIERFKVSGAWIEKAGAVIVVVMDPVSSWWVEDGAAAIENMLLASTALGYGACWVEGDALPREALFKTSFPLCPPPPSRQGGFHARYALLSPPPLVGKVSLSGSQVLSQRF